MRNTCLVLTLITLLELGCVLSQTFEWITRESQPIIVQEGGNNNDVQLNCRFRQPNTNLYQYHPEFFKFQDLAYAEEVRRSGEDYDVDMGYIIADVGEIKGEFANTGRFQHNFESWADQNSNFQERERNLVLTITNPVEKDSGIYVCHIDQSQQTYQIKHTLTVLPRQSQDAVDVWLGGQTDENDDDTRFDHQSNRNPNRITFYSSGDTYGVVECRACAGAAEPIIKIFINRSDITGNIELVPELNVTIVDENTPGFERNGLQRIERCVTRRQRRYQVDSMYDGATFNCSATINAADGNVFATGVNAKTLSLYYAGEEIRERCLEVQKTPRGKEGRISCTVKVNPAPTRVWWERKGDRMQFILEDRSGAGWSADDMLEPGENMRTLTLTFDEVTSQHYDDYTLYIENEAGRSRPIEIQLIEGEPETGPVGGASSLQGAFLVLMTSLLLSVMTS